MCSLCSAIGWCFATRSFARTRRYKVNRIFVFFQISFIFFFVDFLLKILILEVQIYQLLVDLNVQDLVQGLFGRILLLKYFVFFKKKKTKTIVLNELVIVIVKMMKMMTLVKIVLIFAVNFFFL